MAGTGRCCNAAASMHACTSCSSARGRRDVRERRPRARPTDPPRANRDLRPDRGESRPPPRRAGGGLGDEALPGRGALAPRRQRARRDQSPAQRGQHADAAAPAGAGGGPGTARAGLRGAPRVAGDPARDAGRSCPSRPALERRSVRLALNLGYSGPLYSLDMALVLEAERLGYDSVWSAEAYGSDAVTPAAWIAARTERIHVGTSIMQIAARTPAMTAMTAMTLDALSGGRFRLGLGVSGPQVVEGWHGPPFGQPLRKTREDDEI